MSQVRLALERQRLRLQLERELVLGHGGGSSGRAAIAHDDTGEDKGLLARGGGNLLELRLVFIGEVSRESYLSFLWPHLRSCRDEEENNEHGELEVYRGSTDQRFTVSDSAIGRRLGKLGEDDVGLHEIGEYLVLGVGLCEELNVRLKRRFFRLRTSGFICGSTFGPLIHREDVIDPVAESSQLLHDLLLAVLVVRCLLLVVEVLFGPVCESIELVVELLGIHFYDIFLLHRANDGGCFLREQGSDVTVEGKEIRLILFVGSFESIRNHVEVGAESTLSDLISGLCATHICTIN